MFAVKTMGGDGVMVTEMMAVIADRVHQPLGPGPCDVTAGAGDIQCHHDQSQLLKAVLTQHEVVRNRAAIPRCFVRAVEWTTEP
ncbi:hypothetical protein MC885_011498 [Smutsia gigantea]|nr:hypothetical protein MC885_011498 [Smutsia gigantea]